MIKTGILGKIGQVIGAALTVGLLTACPPPPQPPAVTLVSIAVTPVNPSTPLGAVQQFIATGTFSDTTTQILTLSVTWDSSAPGIATVSNTPGTKGLATSAAIGTTTITATLGAISGSTTLTVTAVPPSPTLISIAITPVNPSIHLGTTQQFMATGTFSNNTTQDLTHSARWSSSTLNIATIDSHGLATSTGVGITTITAASGIISGTTTLTVAPATLVSIAITPVNPSIHLGTTQQFMATGTFSDSTTQDLTHLAGWSLSDLDVATIDIHGFATGTGMGTVTITATYGGISGTTALTVTHATLVSIEVTPVDSSIPIGLTKQLTATGIYSNFTTRDLTHSAQWGVSSPSVATIDTHGLATGGGVGITTITAIFEGISGEATLTVTDATLDSIEVTPINLSSPIGLTEAFNVTGIYSDSTIQDLTHLALWSSSDPNVATIDAHGLATGLVMGTTTVTATLGAISGSTTLTVTNVTLNSILLSYLVPRNPIFGFGDTSIALGTTQQVFAVGSFSDGISTRPTLHEMTDSILWSSSDSNVATIGNTSDDKGFAISAGVGTTTITATFGVISSTTDITVTDATLVSIDVAPLIYTPSFGLGNSPISIGLRDEQGFVILGTFSDGTVQVMMDTHAVVWSSSDSTVATISNGANDQGYATGVGLGTTKITATTLTPTGIISRSATLNVE